MAQYSNICNGTWGSHYTIYIDVNLNSQNIGANTSNITVNMWAQSDSSSYGAFNLVAENPVSLYVDNSQVVYKSIAMDFRNRNVVSLASWTGNVSHNADGGKTVSVSGSFSIIGTSSLSSGSTSGNLALTTIPRTSVMTCSSNNVNIGSAITLYTNRASSSFTHTFRYAFGVLSGTIATGVGANCSWTLPMNLATMIPNSTSGGGTIWCDTYSGGTLIGTSHNNFTANAPASMVPTVSISSVVEATSGIAATFGAHIQGKSTLNISVTGSGSYDSTIKSYVIKLGSSVYSTSSITTGILWTAGTNTVTATVTDSRGRTATATRDITVLEYTAPKISTLYAQRCNSTGVPDDGGDHMKVTIAGTITALSNKNSKNFTIKYKKSSDSTYATKEVSTSTYSLAATSVIVPASSEFSYDIIGQATDYFSPTTQTTSLMSGFVLMDWYNSGKGIAFGKVAESDLFDVGINARFRGTVQIGSISNVESDINTLNQLSTTLTNRGINISEFWNNIKTDPLDIGLANGSYGFWNEVSGTKNLPVSGFAVGFFTISRVNGDWFMCDLYNLGDGMTYRNVYSPSSGSHTWNGWNKITLSANTYLPLSGGTMSGNIILPHNTLVHWSHTARIYSPGNQHLYIAASAETSYYLHLGVEDGMWTLNPLTNGTVNLGTPNKKWYQLYCNTGTINTSDKTEKKDIETINSDLTTKFIMSLTPSAYKMIDGTSNRTHWGLIAQGVEEAMNDLGMSSLDFAGFIKSPKYEDAEDENGVKQSVLVPGEYVYGLRYEEFIAPLISVVQSQQNRIEALEEKLMKIKSNE